MSSAGHVLDMIKRMKQNEALKNARKSRFKKVKKIYIKETGGFIDENNLTKRNLSKQELQIIKNKIRFKLEAERRKRIFLTLFFATLISIVLLALFIKYPPNLTLLF